MKVTMKNKIGKLLLILAFTVMLTACAKDGGTATEKKEKPEGEVVIVYTNDVHSYINNTVKDDSGNEKPGLSYASVAAVRDDLEAEGKNVILADAGDHVQGSLYGGLDEGHSVIEIMNEAGYQIATIGNHEFDYGQLRFFQILEQADFPYVSCNFYQVNDESTVLAPYKIIESGGIKIAFVGISTPETITSTTPIYFMDEKQENYLYGFYGSDDGKELYDSVQKAVDAAKKDADYVIALSHLGVDPSSEPYRSIDVIANVTGLDAMIDGHSHTVMESEIVKDAEGKDVVLTQTGANLGAIGKMTLDSGIITCELIEEYDHVNEKTAEVTNVWIEKVTAQLGEQIAVSDIEMVICEPDDPGTRIIRNRETNLGDFAADSYYYYFNEVKNLNCDIAFLNGGGIRAAIGKGDVTYETAKAVQPFGNVACLVEMTGQQLLDALEKGAMGIGLLDEKTGMMAENGGFLHCAGFRYTIDTTVPSTVEMDQDGLWLNPPSGEYRVRDVEIYNKETKMYEPLDVKKTYTAAGINYLLRNMGGGLTMLRDLNSIQDYVQEDYLVFAEYVKAFATDADGKVHISTKNSPLNAYEGYMLDYEDPYGAGRISIVAE